jgi:hypothetical protein
MRYGSGRIYEGDWVNGKRTGIGKFTDLDGKVEEGKWQNDNFLGSIGFSKSKMTYRNGNVYEGEMLDGKPQGKGKMTYTNGNVYEGDWVDNQIHGRGKVKKANGDVYEGDWFYFKETNTSVLHGKGKETKVDGTINEGQWEKGKFVGGSSSSAPKSGGSSNQSGGISSGSGKIGRITEGTYVCPDDESLKVTIKIKGDKIILTDSEIGDEELYTYGEEDGWTIDLINPYKHEIVPTQIEIRDNGMMFFRGEKYIKK